MIPIKPAATTFIFRQSGDGELQFLLLKRNQALKFAPGYWVFPGGRIDDDELEVHETLINAAYGAAVRETKEETGLDIDGNNLQHYYHWTTPKGNARRFGTWFFHTLIQDGHQKVKVDHSEIVDHAWISVSELSEEQRKGHFKMLPPTFISIQRVKSFTNYDQVMTEFKRTGAIKVVPVVHFYKDVFTSMYEGDEGYESGDSTINGKRHRLTGNIKEGTYHFHYSPECSVPSITGGLVF